MLDRMIESVRRRAFGRSAAALLPIAVYGVVGATAALSQSGGKSIGADLRERWKAERAYREKVSAQDRTELVTAPKKGFKPAADAPFLSLQLSLKSPVLRVGESLSYSLALENRGPAAVRLYDRRAFFKRPHLTSSIEWQFWVTSAGGEKIELAYGDTTELAGRRARQLPQMAKEQADSVGKTTPSEVARRAWEADAEGTIDVVLGPGEIFQSRACSVSLDQSNPSFRRGPGYCDYPTDQTPSKPGRYRLMVVMLDQIPQAELSRSDKNLSERDARYLAAFKRAHRHHLGRIESNMVDFEVVL